MDFNKYPKIETCFQRSLETKKLLDGVWRSDELQYLKDCEWIWTEKVDGTNIQIRWDGHRVEFGGRTERANIPQPLMDYLETTFGGEVNEEIFEQLFGETEVVLFGEGYGPKIQSGGGYRKDVSFILFDVKIGNFWLLRDKVEEIAKQLNIDVVPLIGYGPSSLLLILLRSIRCRGLRRIMAVAVVTWRAWLVLQPLDCSVVMASASR